MSARWQGVALLLVVLVCIGVLAWLVRSKLLRMRHQLQPELHILDPPSTPALPRRGAGGAFRLLSLQSGGTYLLASLRYLERVEEEARPGWLESVSCFSGSSMGALIAVLLAQGHTPGALMGLLTAEAPHVLRRSGIWQLLTLGGLSSAMYGTRRLEAWLDQMFGDMTLASLSRYVVIPTMNLRKAQPVVYHNLPGSPFMGIQIKDVIAQSCAVPVLMPPRNGHLDGALVSPNPALHAALLLLHHVPGLRARDLRALTLGHRWVLGAVDVPESPGLLWYLMHFKHFLHAYIFSAQRSLDMRLEEILGDHIHNVLFNLPVYPGSVLSGWRLNKALLQQVTQMGDKYDLPSARILA